MDSAGSASTDRRSRYLSDATRQYTMKKLGFIAYPAIVALSLMASVSAHAQNESMNLAPTGPSANGLTRTQVQAELLSARANGPLKVWDLNYNPVESTKSAQTRKEVRAEAVVANRSQYGSRWYGEDSGSIATNDRAPAQAAAPVYAGRANRAQ